LSVLEPNATQAPFGRAADSVTAGQGFYVVIGNPVYYTFDVVNGDPTRGYVVIEPDLPNYPSGISVSLTAVPYTALGMVGIGWLMRRRR
jgi:hypothetical protein